MDDPRGFFRKVPGKPEGCSSRLGGDIDSPRVPLLVGDVAT